MSRYPPTSGLNSGLSMWISSTWTAAEAYAVLELLDNLRERITAHYGVALMEHMRQDQTPEDIVLGDRLDGEEPF